MLAYAALGFAVFGLLYVATRWFVSASARQIAQAATTFAAVFSAMASTGLLLTGRLGLAIVTVAATVMAVRALLREPHGGDPMQGIQGGPASTVETDLLIMHLDHATGEVEGRVKLGDRAGRELRDLGLSQLVALLQEAEREDPASVPLIEAYLDRRVPDWREQQTQQPYRPSSGMDERMALEILGLAKDATTVQIKAAHRELMSRLHPDHGGSAYLAAQLNQARDFLLGRRG